MNMTKAVKDRFARPCNPCEGCKWYHIKTDTEFPCSHCTHNEMHVTDEEYKKNVREIKEMGAFLKVREHEGTKENETAYEPSEHSLLECQANLELKLSIARIERHLKVAKAAIGVCSEEGDD